MSKHFGFSKPSSGLQDGETSVARTMMDVLIRQKKKTEEKKIYYLINRYNNLHIIDINKIYPYLFIHIRCVCLFSLISFLLSVYYLFFLLFLFLGMFWQILAFIIFQSVVSPRSFIHLNIIACTNHVITFQKRMLIEWLYDLSLCIYFSFPW